MRLPWAMAIAVCGLLASLAFSGIYSPGPGKLRVLSIGINQYPHGGLDSIQYGVADARAVAQTFGKAGGTAAFSGVEVTTLFDEQATLETVTHAFHALADRTSPDDTVIVYFGGQGRPVPSPKLTGGLPEYLFALTDTGWKGSFNPDGSSASDTSVTNALSSVQLSQLLRQLPAQRQIVILDSYESRAALDALYAAMMAEQRFTLRSVNRRFALLGLDGPSPEVEQLGHGILTYALIQGMSGDADGDHDGVITEAELEGYLTWKVPALATHTPGLHAYGEIELASYSTLREFPLSISKAAGSGPARGPDVEAAPATPSRGVTAAAKPETLTAGDPGKDYALILAGDNYDHWPHLNNPIHDADILEKELTQNFGYQVRHRYNPAVNDIYDELISLSRKDFGPRDRVLVYIANHGDQWSLGNIGFLAGKDSLLPSEDPYHITYMQLASLKSALDVSIKAGHLLLVLDSCFSGSFDHVIARESSRGDLGTLSKAQLIERKLEGRSRLYLASGRKTVSDGEPGQHSPFARMFLNILRGYGGDRGLIDMDEIKSKMSGLQERPYAGHFYPEEVSGDFFFNARNDARRVPDPTLN